jgi:hypothetical protein
MKLDAMKFGMATAIVFGLFWIACSVLVMMLPSVMMDMSGHMIHGDMSGMSWHMTISGVVIGLIIWSVFAGFIAGLIAHVYNKMI